MGRGNDPWWSLPGSIGVSKESNSFTTERLNLRGREIFCRMNATFSFAHNSLSCLMRYLEFALLIHFDSFPLQQRAE